MSYDKLADSSPESFHYNVLIKPVFTEKVSSSGTLAFYVQLGANKRLIKESVERIFKVKVSSVRTLRYNGKPKRVGKSVGYRSNYKKAYITLKDGYLVDLVERV